MYQSFIILFREILEISIILCVVLAATQNIKGRGKYILAGLTSGLLGAAIIALFTNKISDMLDGTGQETVNAIILLLASVFIGWTVIWMKQHGSQLAQSIKNKGKQIEAGEASLFSITSIIALSIFREGSEIVLFSYGVIATNKDSITKIITGAFAGFGAGILVGMMFYFGIIKFAGKHIFQTTAFLLTLISASMAAQSGNFFQSAGLLTMLPSQPLWDSSWLLTDTSIAGNLINVITGYVSKPTIVELMFYIAAITIISLSSNLVKKRSQK